MKTKEELPDCPVATTVSLIGSKWKLLILRNLLVRPWRFNELHKSLDGISQKVLTESLRSMEADGIITRTVYPEVPPHVEYALSELGESMRPIIQSVASLPIEELALLAESMINITSLRRKVAIDRNIGTVGGQIDVSIISKGDGFIWLKRKHYFDRKYNPQYFYSHFEKQEEVGENDEE